MRKRLFLLPVLLCVLLLAGGCSRGRTSLTVGFDSDFPPYGYVDEDGGYRGFDIEMAREFCERKGWEFIPVPINWDEKDTLLDRGEVDCVWSGFTITGREEDYTLSIPYGVNRHCITVGAESDILTVKDLTGKVVGVQAASSITEYLLKDPEGISLAEDFGLLAQFSDTPAAYQALRENTLDALITDAAVSVYYVERSGGALRILEETLLNEQYGVAFKKGNTDLCEQINEGLRELNADGTAARLAEEYGISDFIITTEE